MGLDYYNCEICGEIFCDAGHFGHCGGCGVTLCGDCYDEMREKNGELGEEHSKADWYGEEAPTRCDKCDGTAIDEAEFIEFLIERLGSTREELENEYKKRECAE